MLKTGSSAGQRQRERFMLMWRAQLISYQQNSKQADSMWWDGRYTQRYWAPVSISLLFFGRRLLWWVTRISQNKSNFLLENWIALKAHCLFQKYRTLVNMLASLTSCISACVCACVRACVFVFVFVWLILLLVFNQSHYMDYFLRTVIINSRPVWESSCFSRGNYFTVITLQSV